MIKVVEEGLGCDEDDLREVCVLAIPLFGIYDR